jgi:alkylated DNA repair dioxygenase AlkB
MISPAEEGRFVGELETLPFKEFEFHGFLGKRRVVSFGWRYDFTGGGLRKTEDMSGFLLPIRERAAAFAGLIPDNLQQVLLTEYRPGAAIGWHKDRSVFGEVVGISLLSSCTFRLRRKASGGWERASPQLEPRTAYLLQGHVRSASLDQLINPGNHVAEAARILSRQRTGWRRSARFSGSTATKDGAPLRQRLGRSLLIVLAASQANLRARRQGH